MREKLIELLYNFHINTNGHICDGCGSLYAEKVCADIVDHLIANGVTIATDNNVGGKIDFDYEAEVE